MLRTSIRILKTSNYILAQIKCIYTLQLRMPYPYAWLRVSYLCFESERTVSIHCSRECCIHMHGRKCNISFSRVRERHPHASTENDVSVVKDD